MKDLTGVQGIEGLPDHIDWGLLSVAGLCRRRKKGQQDNPPMMHIVCLQVA